MTSVFCLLLALIGDTTDVAGLDKMAIWRFAASYDVQCHENNWRVGPYYPDETSHPSRNTFRERGNPVHAVNCYYCSGCQLSATNFVVLCRNAGLSARAVWMSALDEFENHCVGEVWHKGGTRQVLASGRFNWFGRDPDWADVLGFRGKNDIDSPKQEWTRLDITCDGGHIAYCVNGVLASEGFAAVPSSGKILLQTELAELYVRRFELLPLPSSQTPDRKSK